MNRVELGTLDRFANLQRTTFGRYSLLSVDPVILYIQLNFDLADDFVSRYRVVFEALRTRRAYCLLCHSWLLTPQVFAWLGELEARCRSEFPKLELIHLCNEPGQAESFQSRGIRAIYCSQSCLADEAVFTPMPGIPKRFDAVYDARLLPYKRHQLARELDSLALIYADPRHHPEHGAQVMQWLRHAHYFNHSPDGAYRKLNYPEINECLNACRVGLCLSEEEGAMYASVQYLLSGLPIVTTPSRGGRDFCFDSRYVVMVPPEPAAVRAAVRELVARKLPPDDVRHATLQRLQPHRETFLALVQQLYDENGVGRRFADEWGKIFFHTMLRERYHFRTIEVIRAAAAEKTGE